MARQPLVGLGHLLVDVSRSLSVKHTTLGMAPLDEWSDRRNDLYLTTHNTHKRQASMPPAVFEPAIPAIPILYRVRFSGEKFYKTQNVFRNFLCNVCLKKYYSTKIQRDTMNVERSSWKCPLFISDFNKTCIFSIHSRKTFKYQISCKSILWEPSCSMRTDGQTARQRDSHTHTHTWRS